MTRDDILSELERLEDPQSARGMAKYGISGQKVFGVKIPVLRQMAKEIGRNRCLAHELWLFDSRETRILAGMIDDPSEVTESQMDDWASEFDCWEICDQVCMNLFEKSSHAYKKAVEWSRRDEEFVKRAGFVLMARLAVSDKSAMDEKFAIFFNLIEKESNDPRNFVKKAVNWALRQIGKRNPALNERAVHTAEIIRRKDSPAARWTASDALRELTSDAVQKRLRRKPE